ncbi:DNA-binding MarR family transcriptional regulator [Streptomyces sp. 840.1]|uniref:MarR family winged helix-turn-helix transcriptional regulator n=1 Tax=Streptomyces sp. 840.1 TaxID=2485152 RepID=UPI000FA6A066|nr:MarR family winged helix-turn-helix transcriptional regulator [Streptomyces sp. 840.1]ROQ60146.1 DNA-binding MarR family transcriptional regulator [Streptomyces sp. 840.1]
MEGHLHRQLGLGLSEFYALWALRDSMRAGSGLLPLGDLAGGTGLSPSATSRLVRRLRDRGLITTHVAPHDRRSVETELTAVAHDVLRVGSPLLRRAVEEAVRELGTANIDEDLLRYLTGGRDGATLPA